MDSSATAASTLALRSGRLTDVETVERVATAVATASAVAGTPAVVQFHLHQDRTFVNAPQVESSSSMARNAINAAKIPMRPVGVGTRIGKCCECGKQVIDDGNPEQLRYVCDRTCGAVVWHIECVRRKLMELRNAKEIIDTCTQCGNQLTICVSVDAPVRYESLASAIDAAPASSRVFGWLLYVLGELYILWPLRVVWMCVRFVYYALRFPFVFFVILPYGVGLLAKLSMYSHTFFRNDPRLAKGHGPSFLEYHFVWRDSRTNVLGVESHGIDYDIGHWLFGLTFQIALLTFGGGVYVVYKLVRLMCVLLWRQARFQLVAVRTRVRAHAE